MKVITKLFIPDSFDKELIDKIVYATNIKAHARPSLAKPIVYAREELQKAFSLGIEQGKLEALRAIKEELEI